MYLPILHKVLFTQAPHIEKNVTVGLHSHRLLLIKPRIHSDFAIVTPMCIYTCFNTHLKNKIEIIFIY